MTNDLQAASLVSDEVLIQRSYYKDTAHQYDRLHVHAEEKDEHFFALKILEGIIDFHGIRSVLDIGAGTGRVAQYLKQKFPELRIMSVEPVQALREVGHAKGLSRDELVEGDVNQLRFKDGEFDLVCAFGVLHHVKQPIKAVSEMLRVGKSGVFISDANNFGQGSPAVRAAKQVLHALNLWGLADLIKTKGKGYTMSEGDGLAYSYSVFDNYKQIAKRCDMYLFNTQPAGASPYRTASHLAVLGIKKAA